MAKGKDQQRAAAKAAKDAAEPGSGRASKGGDKTLVQKLKSRPVAVSVVVVGLALLYALMSPGKFRVVPIERVAAKDMTLARFLGEFSNKKPVIVTGAWNEDGWRPEEVVKACPHAYVRTMAHEENSKYWAGKRQIDTITLKEYYDTFFKPEPSQRPKPLLYGFEMSLNQYCPQLLEKMVVPSYLGEDAFHLSTNGSGIGWPSVFFGPKESETALHIDTHRTPFWLVAFGKAGVPLKRLRAFPHTDNKDLMKYGSPGENTNFRFDYNAWNPDFRKYPALAGSFTYEADLQSGEIVYVPGGAPHAAWNHEDNMACSMNYMDLQTFPDFVRRCSKNSPLCDLLRGKGEGLINALMARREKEKPVSYFDFAGVDDKATFCKAQKFATHRLANAKNATALDEYCAGLIETEAASEAEPVAETEAE